MKKTLLVMRLLSFILAMVSTTHALEVETHQTINEYIARNSFNGFSLDSYLKDQLGLQVGIEEEFNSQKAFWWLREGGKREDIPAWYLPYLRSVNHFHNPITEQGYSGFWGTGIMSGMSSTQWALLPKNTQSTLCYLGCYSWYDVRDYYYKALTSTSKTTRDTYFTQTFRGVGQLMHLIEDASVPAHTRDDGHVFYNYENYAKAYINKYGVPVPTSSDFFGGTVNNIASFIDTNQYIGNNPTITVSNNTIGLSEYTNANFFSEDTIFTETLNTNDPHYFPYPRKSSTDLQSYIDSNKLPEIVIAEDGVAEPTFYIKKDKDGEVINHFVKPGYLTKEALDAGLTISYLTFTLDDVCYKDYASLLIPRAVGYSAGLLNYFFRGTLEITMPDSYIYSITDGSIIPQQFSRLKAKVRNSTPDSIPGEEIQNCNIQQQNCIIQAVARYKKRTDYQPDLSTDPPTSASREANYSYSVSAPIVITSLSSTTPAEFTFDFTTNPIPAGITDLYLHVVFKGTLGNEANIAIAVGMKDLNEPQHFSIWNATDRFYLDGVLRTANEIRNNPSLLSRVDHNGDGISDEPIDPYDVTTEIAFYPSGVTPTIYNATSTPLPSGRYGRIIILTDMPTFYILIHRSSTNPPDDMTTSFLFSGVTNQDINGTFQNTQVITFRGIIQHTWSAYARFYPDSTGITTAPWPVQANINPYPTSTMYP